MLLEKRGAELGEALGAILKRSENALTVIDFEAEDSRLVFDCAGELRSGRLVDSSGKLLDELTLHGDTGDGDGRGRHVAPGLRSGHALLHALRVVAGSAAGRPEPTREASE